VEGSVASVVSISRDITRRVRAERALRERERVLGAALNAAGVGVVVVTPDGVVAEWSAAQERLTGVPGAEALGRPIWDVQSALLPAESRRLENVERVRASFAALLSGDPGASSEAAVPFMVERPDGSRRLVEMSAVAGSGTGGPDVGDRDTMLVTRQVEPRPRTDRPGGEHGPA
jgi:PAS domain S-box-containing protein